MMGQLNENQDFLITFMGVTYSQLLGQGFLKKEDLMNASSSEFPVLEIPNDYGLSESEYCRQ